MKPDLLEFAVCPACGGALALDEKGRAGVVEAGVVHCAACKTPYQVREGILDLNPAPTEAARREMEAHRVLEARWHSEVVPQHLRHLVEGEAGLRNLLSMPRCPYPELVEAVPDVRRVHETADDFFALLDRLHLRGDENVLEIGSHLGWSAYRLAERCGRVVATDISHQLSVAQGFIDHGPYFDRVYCDMMTLPFRPACFDMIFGVAVVHHADDLPALFRRCRAVLRSGGRAVFFAEPVVGVDDAVARASFGAADKAFGVQEHVYTIDEYFDAAQAAGFTPHVLPLAGILHEPGRKHPTLRRAWCMLLRLGLGRTALFTRIIYPRMLRRYPQIPFPRFALVLDA